MGWSLDFSNLGPLHIKAKPVGYKGPLQGHFNSSSSEKEKQIRDYMGSQKKFQVGQEWGGDFSNLGPLAQRVKPMYMNFGGAKVDRKKRGR